jgi:hypothetical protein
MAKFKGITSCAALIALLFLLAPVAGAVTAGQPDAPDFSGFNDSQALPDSALRDIRGKGTITLSGFGNGLTNMAIQVNQINGGSATQVSTYDGTVLSGPGTQVQTLPSHISTTLQSLQRLFQRWRR